MSDTPTPSPARRAAENIASGWIAITTETPTIDMRVACLEGIITAELEKDLGRAGHNQPCYYCGEFCNDLAGNPGEWSIMLCHPDAPGEPKAHHERCVNKRLQDTTELAGERAEVGKVLEAVIKIISEEGHDSMPQSAKECCYCNVVGQLTTLLSKLEAGKSFNQKQQP